MRFLISSLIILMSLCVSICFANATPPTSLAEPIGDTEVLVWANIAAVKTYSYNFAQYKKNFQDASQYYTANGWLTFRKELEKSKKLEAVLNHKLVVTAVAIDAPLILKRGLENGIYTWQIQMPLLVTYLSPTNSLQTPLLLTMKIIRVAKSDTVFPVKIEALAVAPFKQKNPVAIR